MSTACCIFIETITAITFTMKTTFVRLPSADDCAKLAKGFEDDWGFIQCVGAIDPYTYYCPTRQQERLLQSEMLL